jgi:hypothetical protein
VASLFPGYANSNGAHGYFDIDTTVYADGIHTIYWTARDSAGNMDGIGSRYFAVQNSQRAERTVHSNAGRGGPMWPPNLVPMNDPEPVEIIKGCDGDVAPQKIYPGKDGNITIKIHELQRIEMHVGAPHAVPLRRKYAGFQVVDGRLRRLPIGSTMDMEKGIFYWQPGPGFIGEYGFMFLMRDQNGTYKSRNITINILPGVSR